MTGSNGWLFSHGDSRVWVYIDDIREATKVAVKHLPGPPTGETAVPETVFKDFFKIPLGGFVTGTVFHG